MNLKVKCKKVENREDMYEVDIYNYRKGQPGGQFTSRMERSDIRHLIEILDNGIGTGK